jgi:hypothetical protein
VRRLDDRRHRRHEHHAGFGHRANERDRLAQSCRRYAINILTQFLIEAVVLTSIGGFVGLAVGKMFSWLVNRYSPLPAYVPRGRLA